MAAHLEQVPDAKHRTDGHSTPAVVAVQLQPGRGPYSPHLVGDMSITHVYIPELDVIDPII